MANFTLTQIRATALTFFSLIKMGKYFVYTNYGIIVCALYPDRGNWHTKDFDSCCKAILRSGSIFLSSLVAGIDESLLIFYSIDLIVSFSDTNFQLLALFLEY